MVLLCKRVECCAKIAMRALPYRWSALLLFQQRGRSRFNFLPRNVMHIEQKSIISGSSAAPRGRIRSNGIFFYRTAGQEIFALATRRPAECDATDIPSAHPQGAE
jgi:hypothetical protein